MTFDRNKYRPEVRLHSIEGKTYTTSEIVAIARAKGCTVSDPAIRARLKKGDNTWERLMRPTNENIARCVREINNRKHNEMTEVLQRLGPPRRY